jgi:signal transduction histidine kinase/DNA-binding response OmpR family regulator
MRSILVHFNQLSVKTIINLLTLIGPIGLLTYLLLNLFNGLDADRRLNNLESHQLPVLQTINAAALSQVKLHDFLRSAVSASEEDMVASAQYHSHQMVGSLRSLAAGQSHFSTQANMLLKQHLAYWEIAKKFTLGMIHNNIDYDKLALLSKQMNDNYEQVNSGIDDLRQQVVNEFSNTIHNIKTRNADDFSRGFIIGLFLFIFSLIAAHWVANKFSTPLRELTQYANAISGGQFDNHLEIDSVNEFGVLAAAFNKMSANLRQLIVDLEHSRDQALIADKAKGQFLANMSHELRTPMNGVLGMLELLDNESLSDKQQHYLRLARTSAEALLLLLNDILDFAKIEAGKLETESLDFNLQDTIGTLVETMAHKAQEKGLEVILDTSGVQKTMVKGDPGRIRQIFANLIGNAIKFTEQGEVVITVKLEDAGEQALVLHGSISDTGIGIPQDEIDTLFNTFTQVDASTTRNYGGTGLGLAIVKQLCQLFNGDIKVTSELGQGSDFEFNITLQNSNLTQAVMPTVSINNMHILIVDDNQTNLEVLSGQLALWGVNVTMATGGITALSLLNEPDRKPFDAAILDMQMPIMDGRQLGKIIRAEQRFALMKLILMTSVGERGDAADFAQLGFQGYFNKPATMMDLINALKVIVDDGQALANAKPLVTKHHMKELVNQTAEELTGIKVLLVEDNLINQAVAQAMLSNLGMVADVANNGLEALEKLDNQSYPLILMDCQMPEMDGYEATKTIRASASDYKDITIIAVTAHALPEDREECLNCGMNDYLSKPINANKLKEKLLTWLVSAPVQRD